jgi:hypothetical protein
MDSSFRMGRLWTGCSCHEPEGLELADCGGDVLLGSPTVDIEASSEGVPDLSDRMAPVAPVPDVARSLVELMNQVPGAIQHHDVTFDGTGDEA